MNTLRSFRVAEMTGASKNAGSNFPYTRKQELLWPRDCRDPADGLIILVFNMNVDRWASFMSYYKLSMLTAVTSSLKRNSRVL